MIFQNQIFFLSPISKNHVFVAILLITFYFYFYSYFLISSTFFFQTTFMTEISTRNLEILFSLFKQQNRTNFFVSFKIDVFALFVSGTRNKHILGITLLALLHVFVDSFHESIPTKNVEVMRANNKNS